MAEANIPAARIGGALTGLASVLMLLYLGRVTSIDVNRDGNTGCPDAQAIHLMCTGLLARFAWIPLGIVLKKQYFWKFSENEHYL